ncbi:MAG: ATP-binding protein [Acidimicrobiales bacterium]
MKGLSLKLPQQSLRDRLVITFGIGASILLLLTAGLLYLAFDAQLNSALDQALQDRATDITFDVREGNLQIRSGEPFAQLLEPGGQVIDSTAVATGGRSVLSARDLARARTREVIVERRRITGLGDRGRILARLERTSNGDPVIVVVGESLDTLARARQRLGLLVSIVSPLLIGAVVWCGRVLAGAALRPVKRMAQEAAAISLSEGGQRLRQPPGDDEIAELGKTLNAMLARIEGSLTRERAFVDDASHELRTPLSILRGELELACQRPGKRAEMQQTLASALQEAEQLGRLTEDLLLLARANGGGLELRLQTVELLAAARQAGARYHQEGEAALQVAGDTVGIWADPVLLDRLLANLMTNACRHATSRVHVEVRSDGGMARLSIADDGDGFPPSFLPVAFDRFSRADVDRGRDHVGSGLGLAIVAEAVRAQGGRVEVDNGSPLGGGRVRVWLPVAVAVAPQPAGAG